MSMSADRIVTQCGKGKLFKPLARKAGSMPVGEVYYVDLTSGADSASGADWTEAMLTVNNAYDQVVADGNDYVIVRGWKAETAAAVIATLDVAETHLIGHAGILNPYFPEKGSLYRSTAFDGPHTLITAEFVEVAGFAFNAVQGAGTESSSVSKGALQVGSYTLAGNKAYIHNNYFPDWSSATTVTGITITGSHYTTLETIVVDSIYGNIDKGIYMSGGSGGNPAWGNFEDLYFRGGPGGALATGVKLYAGSSMQAFRIRGVYHTRGTNMFDFTSDYGAYCVFDHLVGDMTEANAFTGGTDPSNRADLWTNMKGVVGPNTYFRDGAFTDAT